MAKRRVIYKSKGIGLLAITTLAKTESALTSDGWFDTGDIATLNEDGFLKISDRSKDLIKSGGEWISSVELEKFSYGTS